MKNSEFIGADKTAHSVPKMQRAWAMPNSLTFSIKPIRELIEATIADCASVCDPFVRNSPFKSRQEDACVYTLQQLLVWAFYRYHSWVVFVAAQQI